MLGPEDLALHVGVGERFPLVANRDPIPSSLVEMTIKQPCSSVVLPHRCSVAAFGSGAERGRPNCQTDPMPLDPDVAEMLATLAALEAPALSEGTIAEARANYDGAPKPPGDPLPRVEDHTIPTPWGDLSVRVYAGSKATNLPIVVFFHGGGLVVAGWHKPG